MEGGHVQTAISVGEAVEDWSKLTLTVGTEKGSPETLSGFVPDSKGLCEAKHARPGCFLRLRWPRQCSFCLQLDDGSESGITYSRRCARITLDERSEVPDLAF